MPNELSSSVHGSPWDIPCFRGSRKETNVDMVKTEIGQLEKAVNALVHRPWLIRREYWALQIECLLGRPALSLQDRQRLRALLDLLGTPIAECIASAQQ
jgi:hypothetical protein